MRGASRFRRPLNDVRKMGLPKGPPIAHGRGLRLDMGPEVCFQYSSVRPIDDESGVLVLNMMHVCMLFYRPGASIDAMSCSLAALSCRDRAFRRTRRTRNAG